MVITSNAEESICIRPACEQDYDTVVALWLEASFGAHGFVPPYFWSDRAFDMRHTYLPSSETHVLLVDEEIAAFISLVEHQLAALFVHPCYQGRGFGTQLLDLAKELRATLSLQVFKENTRAVAFYYAAGFRTSSEGVHAETGASELGMVWHRPE